MIWHYHTTTCSDGQSEIGPLSGSDIGNFYLFVIKAPVLSACCGNVIWIANEEKELVSALEQISSLKMVDYNDTIILTDVGIRQSNSYEQLCSDTRFQWWNIR